MNPILRRTFFVLFSAALPALGPAFSLSAQPASSPAPAIGYDLQEKTAGRVLWVYDGDTLQVAGIGKVRLLGIDAPEREASARDRHYLQQGISSAVLRRIHQEGSQYLAEQVKGKTVTLSCEQGRKDRYGRLLCYLFLPDGRLLNRVMLEKGYAAVYRRFEFSKKTDFLKAEEYARSNRQGLWQ